MNRTARLLLALASLALVTLAALVTPASASAAETVKRYPACVQADGSGGPLPCIWDAYTRGGSGSYIVRADSTTAKLPALLCRSASDTGPCRAEGPTWRRPGLPTVGLAPTGSVGIGVPTGGISYGGPTGTISFPQVGHRR